LGDGATPARAAQLQHALGLDRPIWEQFVIWLGHALEGNLGESITFQQPVMAVVINHLVPTFWESVFATVL